MKELSIVIVNYNVRHFIAKCLESIYKSDLSSCELTIWIVDNNSVDGSVPFIKEEFPEVKLIVNSENKGFSTANNQALAQIRSEYILILNPDTLLQENTIACCLEKFERYPEVGAIGVKMIDGSGAYLPESKRGTPTIWNSACKFLGLNSILPNTKLVSGYYLGHLSMEQDNFIEVLCGAFIFTKKSVLEKTGFFDEDFFMYGEDIDLSVRIRDAGYKILYTPDSTIVHFKGESTKKASFNYIKTFYNAMAIYVSKHNKGVGAQMYIIGIKLIIFAAAILAGFKNFIRALFRPAVDIILGVLILNGIKDVWARLIYHNASYYDQSYFFSSSLTYYFILTFSVWFFGYYENNGKIKNGLIGTVFGGFILLLSYALLPLEYRSSRVLLLIAILTFIPLIIFTRSMFSFVLKSMGWKANPKLLIVANEKNANGIKSKILATREDIEIVGVVSLNAQYDSNYFLNSIENLNELIHQFKIGEVVFSNQDMSMQDIMSLMVVSDRKMNYYIAGSDKSLSIIGSSNKNSAGTIFHLETQFKLSKNHYLRIKRLVDILLSIGLIILKTTLFFNSSLRKIHYSMFIKTLTGEMTLVGYKKNSQHLPFLKPSIFSINENDVSPDKLFLANIPASEIDKWYALNYSPLIDLTIITNRIFKNG